MSNMKPRALLIVPWIHDFAAYDLWSRPRGLLEVGAALKAGGYEVALLDCLDIHYPGRTAPLPKRREDGSGKFDQEAIAKPPALARVPKIFKRYGMPPAEFRRLLTAVTSPDVVLLTSGMTYWWTGVRETIAAVREIFPAAPVIVGGVYATLLPDHAKAHTGADFVAVGDYRESLPGVLAGLDLPAELPPGPLFPAWDLYPRLTAGVTLTSRGCPRRCPYCAVSVLRPQFEVRPAGEAVEEILRLHRDFGVTDVALHDDAIRAAGDDHLMSFLEGLIGHGSPVRLHAVNALALRGFPAELAGLCRRARVATLRFGLETADAERARLLGGKADLSDLHEAAGHLRAAGYAPREIGVYLLAGLPGQPPGEIAAGIEAVVAAGARPLLAEYSPVPQSPLWEEAARASRYDLAEPLFHNNTLIPCAHPELDFAALEQLKEKARRPFRTAR